MKDELPRFHGDIGTSLTAACQQFAAAQADLARQEAESWEMMLRAATGDGASVAPAAGGAGGVMESGAGIGPGWTSVYAGGTGTGAGVGAESGMTGDSLGDVREGAGRGGGSIVGGGGNGGGGVGGDDSTASATGRWAAAAAAVSGDAQRILQAAAAAGDGCGALGGALLKPLTVREQEVDPDPEPQTPNP
jgi:hypothetical protein